MTTGLVLTRLRLHRAQIVVTGVFLALLVAGAVLHGSATARVIAEHRADGCLPPGCSELVTEVAQRYQVVGLLVSYLGLLPAAVGAFWGAPLLGREFETGTTKLAWTQSVSRRSWTLTSIVTLGLLVAVGGIVVGAVASQWLAVFAGFDLPGVTDTDNSFGQVRGTGPLGWWLFGFAVGTASGAVLRRTVPAMVVAIVVVIAATITRNLWFGALAAEQPASAIQAGEHIETGGLIAASVLLAVATTWVVERARA